MLLDLFDRGGFTSGYYEEHNGRDMVALKEKPEFREGNQKLFDYLDRAYVEAELKESVMGHVILETGKPVCHDPELQRSGGDCQWAGAGSSAETAHDRGKGVKAAE